MVIDNKYLVGNIGWLPRCGAYGVELYFLPHWDRSRQMVETVIHHISFSFLWLGWRRWPYINWQLDKRGE